SWRTGGEPIARQLLCQPATLQTVWFVVNGPVFPSTEKRSSVGAGPRLELSGEMAYSFSHPRATISDGGRGTSEPTLNLLTRTGPMLSRMNCTPKSGAH